jgi:hypothetical protein
MLGYRGTDRASRCSLPHASHGDDMTDTPPDRLANNPHSPFHVADLLTRGIGVRFKGTERKDVDEYCISEGWIRVSLGKKVDRKGNPLTLKLSGSVEVWFLDAKTEATETVDPIA